ncbi:hypothetical protein JAU75_15845 [Ochrobactrum sp. Q0168]|nr:hypothetical protein [Ochrobactrum sp. Q0168]
MALQKFDAVSDEAGKLPDFRPETAHMQGVVERAAKPQHGARPPSL